MGKFKWRANTSQPREIGCCSSLQEQPSPPAQTQPLGSTAPSKVEGGAAKFWQPAADEASNPLPEWVPAGPQSGAERLYVDQLLVLPGFGAFVAGWALSATKDVASLIIKAGNQVVEADRRSISRHDRPDLALVHLDIANTSDTAGFFAIFPGNFEEGLHGEVIFKAVWSDGSSTDEPVQPSAKRVLGRTAPFEAVYHFYPDLESSHFFAQFARAAASAAQAKARSVQAYETAAASAVVIFAAPEGPSDLFLLYDDILRNAATLPPEWGIALVARPGEQRPLLLSLAADIRAVTSRAVSIFFTNGEAPTNDAVAPIIQALECERFAFVGGYVSLNAEGWCTIGRHGSGINLLAVTDPISGVQSTTLSGAFIADRAMWTRIVEHAPPAVGGIRQIPERIARSITQRAAMSLGPGALSPLAARINDATGAAHG